MCTCSLGRSTDLVAHLVAHLIEPAALTADKVFDKVLEQVAVPYRKDVLGFGPTCALPASVTIFVVIFIVVSVGRLPQRQ